jgi:protein-S-isoprenylcysteine O-methyltransferase Ste14
MIFFRTFIFTLLIPVSVWGWIPWYLLASNPHRGFVEIGEWKYIGILPMIVGVLIYLWCAWEFATRGKGTPAFYDSPKLFVSHGLYRYVRNPMYLGAATVLFGETIFFQSKDLLIYTIIVCLGFQCFVIFYEEPHLTQKFGDSYRDYCKTVSRWIPGK